MSDLAKLNEAYARAKDSVDWEYRRGSIVTQRVAIDNLNIAAQAVVNALVAALNCEECGGTGKLWRIQGFMVKEGANCPSCSATRAIVKGK